jgi:hypothetical protein
VLSALVAMLGAVSDRKASATLASIRAAAHAAAKAQVWASSPLRGMPAWPPWFAKTPEAIEQDRLDRIDPWRWWR